MHLKYFIIISYLHSLSLFLLLRSGCCCCCCHLYNNIFHSHMCLTLFYIYVSNVVRNTCLVCLTSLYIYIYLLLLRKCMLLFSTLILFMCNEGSFLYIFNTFLYKKKKKKVLDYSLFLSQHERVQNVIFFLYKCLLLYFFHAVVYVSIWHVRVQR